MSNFALPSPPALPQSLVNPNVSQSEAILIVIAPKFTADQCIRPYVFNFNDATISALLDGDSIENSISTQPTNEALNRAIMPSSEDIILVNLKSMQDKWTFMLSIDEISNGAVLRTISAGYFDTEPIIPSTMTSASPILNMNAFLIFNTTSRIMLNSQGMGLNGQTQNSLAIRAAQTHIPHDLVRVAQNPSNSELFVITPETVSSASLENVGNVARAYNEAALSPKLGHHATVPNRLKSPRHQLRDIGSCLDSLAAFDENTSLINDMYPDPMLQVNQPENMMQMMAGQLANSAFIVSSSFDTSKPITLQVLQTTFPNIKVIPMHINSMRTMDIVNPMDITAQNTMSTIVANTIHAMTSAFGFSQLSFTYSSLSNNLLNPNEGSWVIHSATMSIQMDNRMLQQSIERLMLYMNNDLWPIIKSSCGDFEVQCSYDVYGESLLQIHLFDFPQWNGGYVQLQNAMVGLNTPLVGHVNVLDSNAEQLKTLASTISQINPMSPINQFTL